VSRRLAVVLVLALGVLLLSQAAGQAAAKAAVQAAEEAGARKGAPTEDGWIRLFNGKDLTGWKPVGHALWSVEDGAIVGRGNPGRRGNFWLFTEADYDNFVLRLKFWVSPGSNSGVAVRDPSRASGPLRPSAVGYEIQIIDRKGTKMPTGSIYLIQPAVDGLHLSDEWNELEVECAGPRISVRVNGHPAAETRHDRSGRGGIGLQIHDRDQVIKFKDIVLKRM